MTGIRLEVIGKEQLLRKLDKQNFKKPIADSVRKVTLWFHSTVVTSTPVDTGRLRSSMAFKIEPKAGEVFTNVQYAPFVEYGTRKMKARHVERGSSVRRLGVGMFAYSLAQLQQNIGRFLGDLGKAIKVRFD